VRHGKPRAIEVAGDVDGKRPVPILRRDLLDTPRRPGDPGVVDEAVEAAKRRESVVEETCHLRPVGDVRLGAGHLRVSLCERAQPRLVHVARMHPGAFAQEGANDLQPDPGRPRRDEDA
jgi:hypothetical protein